MEKRKITVTVVFEYQTHPENPGDYESDEWLRGLVSNVVRTAGIQNLVDNVDAKIVQDVKEHDWVVERLHVSHGIEIGDMNGKVKTGKKRTTN